jgi:NADPH:quinone reductase
MSQNALVVTELNKPVILTTRPIPIPGPSQLLVKISVGGLNPHDSKSWSWGLFISKTLPSPLGSDIVGTVISLGSAQKAGKFKLGDKVFSFTRPIVPDECGTQEYALVDADVAAKVPDGINDDEAATMALNPLTAFWGLFTEDSGFGIPAPAPFSGNRPGFDYASQKIVVIGAGSAVGKYVVVWAKYAGIETIVVTAGKTAEKERELRELGATHILDRRLSEYELDEQVRAIVGDDLIYVYDAVNEGPALKLGARFLSRTKPGILVSAAGGDFDPALASGKEFVRKQIYTVAVGAQPEYAKNYWNNVGKMIVDGVLKPTPYSVIQGLDAEKVNDVLRDYRDGKAVVKPHLHL